MAEYDIKTEAPTPRKRQQAREKGNVARSMDLTTAAGVLGGLMLLRWCGPGMFDALRSTVIAGLTPTTEALGHADATRSFGNAATATMPLVFGLAGVAAVVNLMQVGLRFNPGRLATNLQSMTPAKGITRLFGQGRGGWSLLMSTGKVLLTGAVVYHTLQSGLGAIVGTQQGELAGLFTLALGLTHDLMLRIGMVLLLLAAADYAWQRHRNEQELRMSRQELRDELRTTEGDPQVRSRRRQLAAEMLGRSKSAAISTATLVLESPGECAVALQYDSHAMHAPRVIAKAKGLAVEAMHHAADGGGVPVIERSQLASALFRLVAVGQEIPEAHYAAAADSLALVYELDPNARAALAAT